VYLFQLKKIAFTFCLVFAVFTANAAGLGNLNLMSGLGEPLNAEIELLSVKADELATIQAMIASEQAYAEQSLEKPSSHNGIKVEVAKNSRGEPILKLFSSQPMSDAFLDMLIQVEWPTGRLVKEYTVLLDPPGYEQKIATTPTVKLPTPAQVLDKNNTEPATSEANSGDSKPEVKPAEVDTKPIAKMQETEQKQPATQVSSEQLAREKAKINYKFKQNGDIKEKGASSGHEESQQTHATARGDTLYAIARANQPEGVSLEQMLVGLYQANPDAFINRNINQLKVGQILNVPSQESLEKISPTQAKRQYKAQSAHWNTYKNKLAGLVKQSKASAEERY
jgi:pilus assembly protein FimV